MIVCKTHIGYGAGNKQDSESSHGAALGPEIVAELRENLDWPYSEFEIPNEIYADWDASDIGQKYEDDWNEKVQTLKSENPEKAELLERLLNEKLPEKFDLNFSVFLEEILKHNEPIATRKASQKVLEFLKKNLPELIGGSADLSGSNNTNTSVSNPITCLLYTSPSPRDY